MDMLVLITVITLLLQVDAQAHTLGHQEIKSSVLDADISFSSSRTIANVEDLVSSSSHDASLEEAMRGKMLRSNTAVATTFNSNVSTATEFPLSNVSPPELLPSNLCHEEASSSVATRYRDSDAASSSSSRNDADIIGNIEPTAACSRLNFKNIVIFRKAAVNSASASDVPTSGQSTSTETTSFQSFSDGSSYSAGTVEPKQEQVVVESTSLEVSALPRQITDSSKTAYISTSTANEARLSAGQLASRTNDENDTSSSNGTLFYTFLVLGVAGLVCAVLASSIQWRANPRNSIMTPPPLATWTPPPSEVHIVMRSRNVAVL